MKRAEDIRSISIALTGSDLERMHGDRTEKKAEYIVRKHLADKYGEQVNVEEDRNGADLSVLVNGEEVERIEVKGTASADVWQKLKVSGPQSHHALKSGGVAIYRVVNVDSESPCIHVLQYGRHFTLDPEPRWTVRRVSPEDSRYSLRGKPYRYDLPCDPVAADEWGIRR